MTESMSALHGVLFTFEDCAFSGRVSDRQLGLYGWIQSKNKIGDPLATQMTAGIVCERHSCDLILFALLLSCIRQIPYLGKQLLYL